MGTMMPKDNSKHPPLQPKLLARNKSVRKSNIVKTKAADSVTTRTVRSPHAQANTDNFVYLS